ncbi:hypothetical protein DFH11DRAFT_1800676 [Phellopilus nigrolimitatus]|nr:hypothetical protein DFH11DRAFT_1800676 [Phellopilus nigrolimitatus]
MSNRSHNKGPAPTKPAPLKKGQACSSCRRRKQRCDGAQPVCHQCSTSGRELDCEYSDGLTPTRTEILEECLSDLRRRIYALESTKAQKTSGTRPDTRGSPSRRTFQLPLLLTQHSTRWWDAEVPPPQITHTLLESFSQHAHQVGWALNYGRLLTNVSTPVSSPTHPHLALVSAMCLWGVRFSFGHNSNVAAVPASLQMQIEQSLFTRACAHLQTPLERQSPQRGLHVVQAEVLLATYLFAMGGAVGGRTLETEYHVNAAVRLALGFGMHQIVPRTVAADSSRSASLRVAAPPIDAIEEGERIAVFWRVFCLDRQWAVANGRPALLRLEGEARVMVTTPWPFETDSYEQGHDLYSASRMIQPLKQFLEEQGNSTSGFDYPALAVKASLLCERASQYAPRPSSDAENRIVDATIFTFVSTLSALDDNAPVAQKARFVCTHATAYLAFVRLHERNAPTDAGAYARCVQAARYISTLLGHLGEQGVMELDPFAMPCFVISCKVLMREIVRMRQVQSRPSAQGNNHDSPDVLVAELDRMLYMFSTLSTIFPVIDSQLNSLREMRVNMQI